MIVNIGSMKCGVFCGNVRLQMGEYSLKTHMFCIAMGVFDIVLGTKWLQILGLITMDLLELHMSF
jgi:hypothetical protein